MTAAASSAFLFALAGALLALRLAAPAALLSPLAAFGTWVRRGRLDRRGGSSLG